MGGGRHVKEVESSCSKLLLASTLVVRCRWKTRRSMYVAKLATVDREREQRKYILPLNAFVYLTVATVVALATREALPSRGFPESCDKLQASLLGSKIVRHCLVGFHVI